MRPVDSDDVNSLKNWLTVFEFLSVMENLHNARGAAEEIIDLSLHIVVVRAAKLNLMLQIFIHFNRSIFCLMVVNLKF